MLEKMMERLKLANVKMLGEIDDPAPYYAASDFFILPSRSEGMSNALLEAMACGLPCVASNIAGNQELIVSGVNGLLFRTEDADDLAARLREVLSNDDLAMNLGAAARETVTQKYSLDAVTDNYIALYANLLKHS